MKKVLYLVGVALSFVGGLFIYTHFVNLAPTNKITPLFSVVLPTYNRAYCLHQAIYSVLGQTYDNFELIVIDDGSVDETEELVKRLAAADSRIKYVKNEENKGIAFSRNRGIDMARGKYVTFIDSDDLFMPTLLASIKRHYDTHPEAIMVMPYSKDLERDGQLGKYLNYPDTALLMFERNVMNSDGTTIPLKFLKDKNLRFSEEYKNAEDYLMWTNVLIAGGNLQFVKEYLVAVFDMKKTDGAYYEQMFKSGDLVRRRFYDYFSGGAPELENRCLFLKHLRKTAGSIFSEEDFRQADRIWCQETQIREKQCTQQENCIFVYHKSWTSELILHEGNRFCKQQGNDCGYYTKLSPSEILLDWDFWGKEHISARPESPQVYYLKN